MEFDKIIIGAGLYGLYSALHCGKQGQTVLVLEHDPKPFMRASYINQARVHMGYHYPRSLSTASKSAGYYRRFHEDFGFCINDSFKQIYATSTDFSWTNAEQFMSFCQAAGIKCEPILPGKYFNDRLCDGAFLTEEDTYDAMILRDWLVEQIGKYKNIKLFCNASIDSILINGDKYELEFTQKGSRSEKASAPYLLNSTYASVNQIIDMINRINHTEYEKFRIKYELCEIILCETSAELSNVGLTVMDGPFFSIMPFGKTGMHSLTSVTFTPHVTSYEELPSFDCQKETNCSSLQLANCDTCIHKPESAWPYMQRLAKKYMKPEYDFMYKGSMFSVKPILKASEIDDSRPTAIRVNGDGPILVSVLSGKINTVYDLDSYLDGDFEI